jgi:hypothetical protein
MRENHAAPAILMNAKSDKLILAIIVREEQTHSAKIIVTLIVYILIVDHVPEEDVP